MKYSHFASTCFVLCSFFTATAQAHNIWLEKLEDNNRYVIKFGHEETESYSQKKLTSVQALSHGKIQTITPDFQRLDKDKGEATITTDSDIVFIAFNNGVWSKLPSGKYVEKTKKEAPTAEFSINPMKIGKAILNWTDDAFKAHNQSYELIPQSMPIAGKPFDILVLKSGQPVEGIKVGLGEDKPFNLTNEQGIVQFTPTAGFNKVWAEFEEKIENNPDYTDRSYEYMLTFDVK